MPKLRLLLASLLGALAATAVMVWPTMPLWQGERGYVLGFSPDGGTLFALHGVPEPPMPSVPPPPAGVATPSPRPPEIWLGAWGSRGGELRRKTILAWQKDQRVAPAGRTRRYPPLADPQRMRIGAVSPDGGALLVRCQASIAGAEGPFEMIIFDAATGARRAKVSSYRDLRPGSFSPDGRWFWTCIGDEKEGVEIIDSATGERVLKYAVTQWGDCLFAKDGPRVWMRRRHARGSGFVTTLRCCALPSGEALREIELPGSVCLYRLDGDRLIVERDETGEHVRRYSLDLRQEKPELGQPMAGLECVLGDYTKDDWIVKDLHDGWISAQRRFVDSDQTPLEKARIWLQARLGRQSSPPSGNRIEVALRDSETQALRSSQVFPSIDVQVSPDARCAAMAHNDTGALMVWSLQPGPRWPWALAAGLAPFALCFLPRRRKSAPRAPQEPKHAEPAGPAAATAGGE